MSKITIDPTQTEYFNEVFKSEPLYKRLTEKEKKKFRVMFKMSLVHYGEYGYLTQRCTTLVLTFGKKMFKDIIDLYISGKLSRETPV